MEYVQDDKIKVVITGIDDAVNLTIADFVSQFYFSCSQVVNEMDEEAEETNANLTDMLEKRMARKRQQIIDVAVKAARDMLTAETATATSMFVASLPSSNVRDMREIVPPKELTSAVVAPASNIDLLLKVAQGSGGVGGGGSVGGVDGGSVGGVDGGDASGADDVPGNTMQE